MQTSQVLKFSAIDVEHIATYTPGTVVNLTDVSSLNPHDLSHLPQVPSGQREGALLGRRCG